MSTEELKSLVDEQIHRTGARNMEEDFLKVLLLRVLATGAAQKIEAGPAISSVSNHLKWQQLGRDLHPHLSVDGSNFLAWSLALQELVTAVTSVSDYFAKDHSITDLPTSNGVGAIIRGSIDPALRSSLNGMTAYGAYSSLKSRFNIPSWSFLLSRWSDVAQAPDALDSISASYKALKRSLLDLEERLGGWSTDKLLSLCFHSSLGRFQQPIADAMDARLAIAPHMRILPADILNLASRLHQSATSTDSTQTSVMGISSR
jgi:hypothetical protein